jgi:hypothetical protein
MKTPFRWELRPGRCRFRLAAILLFAALWLACSPAEAIRWRPWEFINPGDLEITTVMEKAEIIAGEVATFTIRVRNKTDKTVKIPFETGQRWDYAVFHNETQIYRWSQGLRWEEAQHTLDIKAHKTETFTMSWPSLDRNNTPLPQGMYRIQGMVMAAPRHLVAGRASIRLLPARVLDRKIIKARMGQPFEVTVPRYMGINEILWEVRYVYNDNRVGHVETRCDGKNYIFVFMGERKGHVTVHFYGHPQCQFEDRSLERRTFYVDIQGEE